MDDLLWEKYVAANLEGMILYGNAMAIACTLIALVRIYKKEEFKTWLGLGVGLGLFVALFPKERFLRTTIDTVACRVILKSELAQVVKQLPTTVENTIKAEAKKIPSHVDMALRREFKSVNQEIETQFDQFGDRVIKECKLF